MSTTFWNVLKISPALLGASLLVASSTYAQESNLEQTAKVSPVQTATTVEAAVDPLAQVPQTTAIASSTYTQEQESVTNQTAQVSQTQATVAVEPTVQPLVQPPQTQVKETSVSELPPSDASPSVNRADNTLAQQVPATGETTPNSTDVLQQIESYSTEGGDNSQDQVTNVTQLSDVRPTDWAYEALRSLVERYGCIQGYPDRTFRGNRATTRFEFAAGLNACLNQIERLIAASGEGFATRKDLETIQRLVKEFQAELTTLGARVDKLEGRVGYLEDRQFSTTTKLNGEVIFAISDLFGGDPNIQNRDFDDNTVFQDRVRLNLDTSFTGKDRLRTRLQARNVTTFPALRSNGLTREGRFGFDGDEGNAVNIDFLGYRVPLGDQFLLQLFANAAGMDDIAPTLNPLDSSGSGSISRFGQRNPIYRVGSQSAGASLTFGRSAPIRVDLGYLSATNADPGEDSGIFNGNYSALGQITFQPSKAFALAATYIHSYDRSNLGTGTGSIGSQLQFTAPGLARLPIVGNSYGVEASFSFTPQFILSGWAGYTQARILGRGDADVWNYGATLALNDFGPKGSTLGFVVGIEPKLTGTRGNVFLNAATGTRRDRDTGFHVEGFYKLKLTNNIAVTPGVIWLTAPGHDARNDDIFVGTLRTTFTF
ncbi:MAG TPA: iron uptake porin [Coleofasciculaceae cyanobacterium]